MTHNIIIIILAQIMNPKKARQSVSSKGRGVVRVNFSSIRNAEDFLRVRHMREIWKYTFEKMFQCQTICF